MQIQLSSDQFASVIGAKQVGGCNRDSIQQVSYDTRKISNSEENVFFALAGSFRDGHTFITDAHAKGIRFFVVNPQYSIEKLEDTLFFVVEDTLKAIQQLASFHRKKFSIPVIAITGSVGKTIVKEWLYQLLSTTYSVVRSPKSYNSQLGVALSLLEIKPEHEIALIEAGISQPNEMHELREMILPTHGIFTAFGSAHRENFESESIHFQEKIALFTSIPTFASMSIQSVFGASELPFRWVDGSTMDLKTVPFSDQASLQNASLAFAVARELNVSENELQKQLQTLTRLALRMETVDGIQGNTLVNDTYNLDLDALNHSLEYTISIAQNRPVVVILATDTLTASKQAEVQRIVNKFAVNRCIFVHRDGLPAIYDIRNSVILIKGTRASQLQRIVNLLQLKKHKTRVEINFSAIAANLRYFKSVLFPETKLLVMVKAASYGSGAEKVSTFLEKSGVDYLGVAYADEGVELRKNGITLPILVMNAEEEGFQDIIDYDLIPALYSFEIVDAWIKKLILLGRENFPVHIKVDSGMRRLGFEPSDVEQLAAVFETQPEIKLAGIFSHLADADHPTDGSFTDQQAEKFTQFATRLTTRLGVSAIIHLLNTEGIARFTKYQFDLVRLGIGIYGSSSQPEIKKHLQPAIAWKSMISQVKTISAGESVGYSRTFVARGPMKIATIPVGYADGFRRSLSNGVGGVVIHGAFCPVVGNVCMDMTMVDITDLLVKAGDEVEIIGTHQSLEKLATAMNTIPYEVLTSISKRVHRVYLEE